MKKAVINYHKALKALVAEFAFTYFPDAKPYLIGDETVGFWPLEIADYYWSIDDMSIALYLEIPYDTLIDWYNYNMDSHKNNKLHSNLKNYFYGDII